MQYIIIEILTGQVLDGFYGGPFLFKTKAMAMNYASKIFAYEDLYLIALINLK